MKPYLKYANIFAFIMCILFLFIIFSEPTIAQNIAPPIAERKPMIDTLHNDIRTDYYGWLKDKTNPEVVNYLTRENDYTRIIMAETETLQETLYQEMLSRIKETDLSVPEKIDDYFYYSRTEEGKQYSIYCRKKGNLQAPEEILLDQNELAEGFEYFELGIIKISPDHTLLAYSIDTTGSERYLLFIKDLRTGGLLKEHIPNTGYYAAWANDNTTLFYTILDNAKRPHKLYRHTLGSDPAHDDLILHEKNDAFWLSIYPSKSKEYLFMEISSHTTAEIYYLKSDTPFEDFKLVHPRKQDIEYYLEHHDDLFYILTNENAKNFRLMYTPVSDPKKHNWKQAIPHRDAVKIESFDIFENHLVLYERKGGLEEIRITNLIERDTHYVEFPEPVYTIWRHRNPEFNTNLVRFTYNSLVTPRSVFDYNMDNRERELKKQYEVLGGYDPEQYQSERIFAQTSDRTLIPISLVYRKGIQKNGQNPLFLTGYGAYGSSFDPYFSSNRLSLLDRGFIYAIAHVRGGGEMGRYWYDEGKLLNKMNTFTDFITCAEQLISENYTIPARLVISGGSAGGLLIGAVINMRPELFGAVLADVPFVDLINTMLDPNLPLTVLEYEEWGNPNDPEFYTYMKKYSPYDNVSSQDYPPILITAGLNDTRVMYWEAAKWTAKLRAHKTDKNPLLLRIKMGTGHLGASGRYDFLKDIAFEYSFVLHILGLD